MKKLTFIYLLFTVSIFAQEKIRLEYQEWDLKSFKQNRVLVSEQEGVWLDNISKPEIEIYRAKGNSITDKAMIICPGGVSPNPITNKEFMRSCKQAIASYALLYPVPSLMMKIAMGEMSKVILNSNRVIPQKLNDVNFTFKFPELKKAVMDLMERDI